MLAFLADISYHEQNTYESSTGRFSFKPLSSILWGLMPSGAFDGFNCVLDETQPGQNAHGKRPRALDREQRAV